MFIKRMEGPRVVKLPDGSNLSRADLPPADTVRWVARRKAAVAKAIAYGLISQEEAKKTYALSDEEIAAWLDAISGPGLDALKVTSIAKYR